jgi:hypothetical protein
MQQRQAAAPMMQCRSSGLPKAFGACSRPYTVHMHKQRTACQAGKQETVQEELRWVTGLEHQF